MMSSPVHTHSFTPTIPVEHPFTLLILSGSSIGMVYTDAAKLYAEIKESGEKLRANALGALQAQVTEADEDQERANKKRRKDDTEVLLVVNTVDVTRTEIIEVPGAQSKALQDSYSGHPLCTIIDPLDPFLLLY